MLEVGGEDKLEAQEEALWFRHRRTEKKGAVEEADDNGPSPMWCSCA